MANDMTELERDDLLLPRRSVMSRHVGPSSCKLTETTFDYDGRSYRRFDVGLDGSVEGYSTKEGPYKFYPTNVPDLMFPQCGNTNERLLSVAHYERDKGAAFILVIPSDRVKWNGKAFVTAHGRGRSFVGGQLKAWNKYLNPQNPIEDLNRYDLAVIQKGFALVKTCRTSHEGLGEILLELADGSTSDEACFNDCSNYIVDFFQVARRLIREACGSSPSHSYLYGHSAGARIARGMNYTSGANVDAEGSRIFDGFLVDDAAAGTWLPIVMQDGIDVLLKSEADRSSVVPQLELCHLHYNAIWNFPLRPSFVTDSFLENKRRNALLMQEKGLGDRFRYYEIGNVSHRGGEAYPYGGNPPFFNLDLPLMMSRFIDILDDWVSKGVEPPANRAEFAPIGAPDSRGALQRPAIRFPEATYPLGVYFPYPKDGATETSFAPFNGEGLEPRDGAGMLVDMNRNGVWDRRETVSDAWRRLGLLKGNETFSRSLYVQRIKSAAEQLKADGFFDDAAIKTTVARAEKAELYDAS